MTKKKDFLDVVSENRFIHILISILLGFLVGALFLSVMGLSVGEAYGRLITSITSLKGCRWHRAVLHRVRVRRWY